MGHPNGHFLNQAKERRHKRLLSFYPVCSTALFYIVSCAENKNTATDVYFLIVRAIVRRASFSPQRKFIQHKLSLARVFRRCKSLPDRRHAKIPPKEKSCKRR